MEQVTEKQIYTIQNFIKEDAFNKNPSVRGERVFLGKGRWEGGWFEGVIYPLDSNNSKYYVLGVQLKKWSPNEK